jgi:isocitrate dehydrogenase kinase/phosphatase
VLLTYLERLARHVSATTGRPEAYAIAQALMHGFNQHYRMFSAEAARAKQRFETMDWPGQQQAQRERIEFYDLQVRACIQRLEEEFAASLQSMAVWQQVKLHYIGLMVDHLQPELAETFFNSVTTKILHRTHFQNDFIFVRAAVSTEYLENTAPGAVPIYRAYYPGNLAQLEGTLQTLFEQLQLQCRFEDLQRDVHLLAERMREAGGPDAQGQLPDSGAVQPVLSQQGAYLVGKIITGYTELPLAIPILHGEQEQLILHAALFGEDDLHALFSFARAYFMVDMEVPSAYVSFLRSLMPRKPKAEIYNALGLAKQGKTLFYRDFLHHLRHSSDQLRIAPGIKGMVMLVFDLPSFPYVFKLIKDRIASSKDVTRPRSRPSTSWSSSMTAAAAWPTPWSTAWWPFPERFSDELLAELHAQAPARSRSATAMATGRWKSSSATSTSSAAWCR